MKKRICLIISLITFSMIMTACTDSIPEMTQEQQAEICEYAAQLLVSYDKYHTSNVLSAEEEAEEQQRLQEEAELRIKVEEQKAAQAAAQAQAEEDNGDGEDAQGGSDAPAAPVYQDIDEFLGLAGLDISYRSYTVCDSYPETTQENDWQGVCQASGTNKLVVFEFDVTNTGTEDYYLDMASMDTRFTFQVDGISKAALTTLLANDFIMFRDTIPAGSTNTAVIVIEMSADDAESITSVSMKMKYNGNISETTLF